MPRQLSRFLFWFSACALLMIGFAIGPITAGEVTLENSTASPIYVGVVSFCFSVLITFGSPTD